MHATVAIPCLIAIAIVGSTTNMNYKVKPKIIGGSPIAIDYRPFMLSIHDNHGFLCGGSILSENWGITALHCLIPMSGIDYYVRAGSDKPDQGGSVHKVTKIHVYNESTFQFWSTEMLYHDIALFQVSPRFRFSKTVRAVRLPKANRKPPSKLLVSGWGYSNSQSNEEITDVLMGVYVRRIPFESCVRATPEYATLIKKDYHLCYGTRGKDACYGDSGGPLANRNKIYGIVSFGYNCGIVSGVYAKVSYYRRWIKEVTNL